MRCLRLFTGGCVVKSGLEVSPGRPWSPMLTVLSPAGRGGDLGQARGDDLQTVEELVGLGLGAYPSPVALGGVQHDVGLVLLLNGAGAVNVGLAGHLRFAVIRPCAQSLPC